MAGDSVSPRQIFWLFATSRLVVTVVFLPALSVAPRNQDYWLVILISWPLTVAVALVWLFLWQRYPDKSMVDLLFTLAGPIWGRLLALPLVAYLVVVTDASLRQSIEFVSAALLPRTPLEVIAASLTLVAVIAAHQGLEVVGRTGEAIAPVFIGSVLLIVGLLATVEFDLATLLPILEKGWWPVLKGSATTTARWIEFLWLSILIPRVSHKNRLGSALMASIALTEVMSILMGSGVQVVLSPNVAANLMFPFLSSTRFIAFAEFFERVDPVFVTIWIAAAFSRVTLLVYASTLAISRYCCGAEPKPLLNPTGLLVTALSLWFFTDLIQVRYFGRTAGLILDTVFSVAYPLLLTLLHLLRVYKNKKAGGKESHEAVVA